MTEAQIDTFPATMFYFQDSLGLTKLQTWISRYGNAIELSKTPYKAVFKNEAAQSTIITDEKYNYCFGVLSMENVPSLDSLFEDFSQDIK